MASVFFDQFGLRPDVYLNIKQGHPGVQIGDAIAALVQLFLDQKPDIVLVVGDVNSTLAGAIAANKCNIPLAHLESGLRSNDLDMPEEHNRRVTDLLSNLHFITEDAGIENLRKEGMPEVGLSVIGNTMIDTLVAYQDEIAKSVVLDEIGVKEGEFTLVTMHRPSNVDTASGLALLADVFESTSRHIDLVFASHPRTLKQAESFGLMDRFHAIRNLQMIPAQGYFNFQKLVASCKFVLTDSGGIQEETTFLRKPCLTLRPNTERPVTITQGTNTLLQFDLEIIEAEVLSILKGTYKTGQIPFLWDGKATQRALNRISAYFDNGF
jgi:UDP-N-acetylglucosamine 2-epimerase (non-hydrolysing)